MGNGEWREILGSEDQGDAYLRKARESRERQQRQGVNYPDMREETEDSIVEGRKQVRLLKKEAKEMAKKSKQKTAGVPAKEKKIKKVKGPKYPDKASPPQVGKNEKAVWHDPYSYKNKLGNVVTIQGHYEVIKVVEKPVKKDAE